MTFIGDLVAVEWDFNRFSQATKVGVKWKENLEVFFQMARLGKVDKPATIVDRHGKLLVWYLPNIFFPGRTVCFPQADSYFGYIHGLPVGKIQLCCKRPEDSSGIPQLFNLVHPKFHSPQREGKIRHGNSNYCPWNIYAGPKSKFHPKMTLIYELIYPPGLATCGSNCAICFFETT